MMKKVMITAAVLLGSTSLAMAQSTTGTNSPGASRYSPGHEMQNSKTNAGPGASEFSPGDRMRDRNSKGTVGQSRGASELSPGDRMNDKRNR